MALEYPREKLELVVGDEAASTDDTAAVARRHLGPVLLGDRPGPLVRADCAATLGAVVALPVVALAAPLVPVAWWHSPGLGPLWTGWLWVLFVPLALPPLLFALDRRDGRPHDRREYAAVALLWPYVVLQVAAMVAAFVAEFVRRAPAVYVTSTEAEE